MEKSKHISTFIRIFVSIFFLGFLYFQLRDKIEIKECLLIIKNMGFFDLVLIIILGIILSLWKAYIWKFILKNITSVITFKYFLFSVLASNTLNVVLPGKTGDIIRFIHLRGKIEIGKCIGSLFIERLYFLIALSLLSMIGATFTGDIEIFLFDLGILILALMFFMLMFSKYLNLLIEGSLKMLNILDKVQPHLNNFKIFGEHIKKNSTRAAIYFSFCVVFWLIVMFQLYWLFESMKIEMPFSTLVSVIPAGIILSMIPISIGGLGVREFAFLELLRDAISPDQIIAFATMFYIIRYLIPALIGLPFIISVRLHKINR